MQHTRRCVSSGGVASEAAAQDLLYRDSKSTDIGARSMPSNPSDEHTLAGALEQAAILSDVQPEIAVVDRGHNGVAIDGVRSITRVCDAASRAACEQ